MFSAGQSFSDLLKFKMAYYRNSLRTLPVEILVSICEFMCPHCVETIYMGDQTSLARLCLASRLFRDIAQPVLFHFYGGSHGLLRHRILQAVSQRPNLAASMRILNLTEDRSNNRTMMLKNEDAQFFEDLAAHLEFNIEPGWTRLSSSLYEGNEQDYLECIEETTADMLITCLPNLEQLALQWDQYRSLASLTYVLQQGQWDGLPFLKYLQLDHWDTEGCFNASTVRGLLRATPNIETLSMQMCSFYEPNANAEGSSVERFPILRKLKRIELSQCSISPSGLATLESFLASCPTMEQFDFVAGLGETRWAMPRDVIRTLLTCSTTLRGLSLDYRGIGPDVLMRSQIKTLRGFSCLENISVDMDLFCTYYACDFDRFHEARPHDDDCLRKLLPQSIKTVQLLSNEIRGPCEQDMYQLGYECLKGGFPHLKLVSISRAPEELSDIPAPLLELFNSAGVELEHLIDSLE